MVLKDICADPETNAGLSVIPLNDTCEEPETNAGLSVIPLNEICADPETIVVPVALRSH